MILVLYCILKALSRRFVCAWFQDLLINSVYGKCADPYSMTRLSSSVRVRNLVLKKKYSVLARRRVNGQLLLPVLECLLNLVQL
jgi:hypothetical protein